MSSSDLGRRLSGDLGSGARSLEGFRSADLGRIFSLLFCLDNFLSIDLARTVPLMGSWEGFLSTDLARSLSLLVVLEGCRSMDLDRPLLGAGDAEGFRSIDRDRTLSLLFCRESFLSTGCLFGLDTSFSLTGMRSILSSRLGGCFTRSKLGSRLGGRRRLRGSRR